MLQLKTPKRLLSLLLSLTALYGCVDPVRVEVPSGEELLVVEGLITDLPEDEPFVRISYSQALGSNSTRPLGFAQVTVCDDLGNTMVMQPEGNGFFRPDPSGESVVRTPGRTYTLEIQLGDATYLSDPVTMQPVADIDDVYFVQETKRILDEQEKEIEQVGFSIRTRYADPVNEPNYYRWQYTGVYRQQTILPFTDDVEQPGDTIISGPGGGGGGGPEPTDDCCNTCWITDLESLYGDISIYQDEFTDGGIIDREVFFLPRDLRFLHRYRFLLRQLSVEESGYEFWRSLLDQRLRQDFLFDREIANTIGNLRNANNPDEIVLGYFGASAAKTREIIFDTSINLEAFTVEDTVRGDCRLLPRSVSVEPPGF